MNGKEVPPHNSEVQKTNSNAVGIFAIAISYVGSILKYHLQKTLSIKDAKNLTRLERKFGFLGVKFPLHGDHRRGY